MTYDYVDILSQIKDSPSDFKILKRIGTNIGDKKYLTKKPWLINVLYLDVETTGTDARTDGIVQLSLMMVAYDSSGIEYEKSMMFCEFNDPGIDISKESSILTGICVDDYRGTNIDHKDIVGYFENADLVISHNALFDRGFIDRTFPDLPDVRWACSINDAGWDDVLDTSKQLEVLLYKRGYFFDSHSADQDVLALIFLMSLEREKLKSMIENAFVESVRIVADKGSYEHRDALKSSGFRFDVRNKNWFVIFDKVNHQRIVDKFSQLCDIRVYDVSMYDRYRSVID